MAIKGCHILVYDSSHLQAYLMQLKYPGRTLLTIWMAENGRRKFATNKSTDKKVT